MSGADFLNLNFYFLFYVAAFECIFYMKNRITLNIKLNINSLKE